MKKALALFLAAAMMALLLAACGEKAPEQPAAVLTGTVLEVDEGWLLVQPDTGDGTRSSGDQFDVSLADGAAVLDEAGQATTLLGGIRLYDRVSVDYDGQVRETYPCQITASAVRRLPKEPLTMEALLALAEEKGSGLTWIDFAPYQSVETGSGLYILRFEMAEDYSLWIGGSPVEDPMYIYLRRGEGDSEERIEVREKSIRDFLEGTAQTGAAGDYPAALMVDGKIYLLDDQPMPAEVEESAVIGHTTTYTDGWPAQEGETNFCREPGLPYARVEGGIALLYESEWYLCRQAKCLVQ